ncbi:hypothetical protein [Novispirillum itersonii]|uniref:Uncharacterized protein n=1 Tax=Novispirillum itersonii TaxID=189 RepID=A0A7W9ZGK0_NOVIT|nr:hypothetical protein [Novispirillum itersonii]MBB6211103.1 hypothetical protein [Novispirillum itersonii]
MTSSSSLHDGAFPKAVAAEISGVAALALRDQPDLPLVFNVPMPEGFAYPAGDIGLSFHDLTLAVAQDATVVCIPADLPGEHGVTVALPPLRLTGTYRLNTRPTAAHDLDTGGTMLPLSALKGSRPAGAVPPTPTPPSPPVLTPEQADEMMQQARDQKPKLRETLNGQQLLNTYGDHNETFNMVFNGIPSLRALWSEGGATTEMMLHTHSALKTGDVVNPGDGTTFGTQKVTYNGNAFAQRLNVITASVMMEGNPFDPNFQIDPDSPYTQAALSTLTFQSAVALTGNAPDGGQSANGAAHTALKGGEIYNQIGSDIIQPAPATVDQLENILAQGLANGPGAAGAAAQARENNWHVLSEADRSVVRRMAFLALNDRAQAAEDAGAVLWSGAVNGTLTGAVAQVRIGADGARAEVTLPAFAIDLDDSGWTGPGADAIRARLRDLYFVRRMLHDGVTLALSRMLERAARKGQPDA